MHKTLISKQVGLVPQSRTDSRFRIVVVGGGTGASTALSGLCRCDVNLSAIVSVMDSGGSSGRLRKDYGVLPPGDARQCLVALANDDETAAMLGVLFTYRFRNIHSQESLDGSRPLDDHNLGNLLISALIDITGSVESAYAWVGRLLGARGQVIPVSTSHVQLCAQLTNGQVVSTEAAIDSRIDQPDAEIDYVYLDRPAYPSATAISALRAADLVVMGPGDLYTSIIPNLLVNGISEAIAAARHRVFVLNLMTKPGETDRYRASTFVARLLQYMQPAGLDAILVNTTNASAEIRERYAKQNAFPVEVDHEAIETMGIEVVAGDFASVHYNHHRHDPMRLATTLCEWLGRRTGPVFKDLSSALAS